MTYRFTARAVAAEVDVDGEMQAGLAEYEDEDEEGFFLLFTRSVGEPSPQDVALGLDTYGVMTPDQCTAYGCVREVALVGSLLTVTLDPGCLDELELEEAEIEVRLDLPAEVIDELCDVLTKVLTYGRPDARPRLTGLPVHPSR
ncbi:Imm10 family immunity protein [Streptomyces sp. NPDC002238]|uniref:Imm10 family immunity protein n=1 Tax=Streptomyces sp. NPDC002238 TaxID=3156649 RepID=UPI00331C68AB